MSEELPVPEEAYTEGVKTLLGDPKRAIVKLSLPMIMAMLIQATYNLADAIWVAGIGADALAAVGFVFPFYFIMMAISTGIGIGSSSAIARRIGARDKAGADSAATNSIVLVVISAVIFTVPLVIFTEPIFGAIGAGGTLRMTVDYARIISAGAVFLFFNNVGNAILRGEGDAKRAMYALGLGAGLNIILDPMFIYVLGFGVAGAALATVLSMSVSSALLLYWLAIKNDTYVSIRFRGFRFHGEIVKDILRVGIPSSIVQVSMSLSMLLINFLIVLISQGGTDGVAVYSAGWRVATVGTLPLNGIATAVVAVCGAAFGERAYDKISVSHLHAIKIGLLIEAVVTGITFVFAPQIAAVFTYSEGAARIAGDLTLFLRIICLFWPFVSFGMQSSALFQAVGRGVSSLMATVFRALVLTLLFIFILAFVLNYGLLGVWWGIVLANIIGSLVVFSWARLFVRGLMRRDAKRLLR
ncbi:MAG: MATE family efflux transporter [Candidatus Hadarchaeum sp.]|uniref:MATE family efflux transporter n=1 Tax=Candidatus Hadarchaeum sp. TaxID=2883567 RepID=UPI003D109D9D